MYFNKFNELLSKEMTRKEFLTHIGILFLVVTGISGLLGVLTDPNLARNKTRQTSGFGSGPYGL